jgi:hypothetical protein
MGAGVSENEVQRGIVERHRGVLPLGSPARSVSDALTLADGQIFFVRRNRTRPSSVEGLMAKFTWTPLLLLFPLLTLIGTSSPAGPLPSQRGSFLFRVAGRSGRACLSCHDASSLAPAGEGLRAHVAEQFGPMAADDFRLLVQQLDQLIASRTNSGVHEERDDLTASMRSLGYLDYQHAAPPRPLGAGIRLNAYELTADASGAAALVPDPSSPTRQSLRLDGRGAPTGVVLPPYRVEPGSYTVTIRSTADLPPVPGRFLAIAQDKSRRDLPLARSAGGKEATGTFAIERTTPATFSMVVSADQPITIAEVEISRER